MSMDRVENIRGPSYEDKGENGGSATPDVETIKPLRTSGDLGEDLLPGIRNDITLSMVCSMLSFADLLVLSTVSRGWKQAIESGLVYNERVRTHSIDSLAVVTHLKRPQSFSPGGYTTRLEYQISLYSIRDKFRYELPLIPGLSGKLPQDCQCVSIDSKLYLLGGQMVDRCQQHTSQEVYVLDLARQKQWCQCASMQEPRTHFLATVTDGKIYVFGGNCFFGTSDDDGAHDCEVYDPNIDAWSSIKPRGTSSSVDQIVTLGEEVFLFGGTDYSYTDVYHPVINEWRYRDIEINSSTETIFSTQGKFLLLRSDGIFGLDTDEQSWKLLQACSFPERDSIGPIDVLGCFVVGDELLALVAVWTGMWVSRENGSMDRHYGFRQKYIRSCGFGQENEQIVWETITGLDDYAGEWIHRPITCSIQL